MNTFDLAYEMQKVAARGDYIKKFIYEPMNDLSKSISRYSKTDANAVDNLISNTKGNVKADAAGALRDVSSANKKLEHLIKNRAPGKTSGALRDTLNDFGSGFGSTGDVYESLMRNASLAPKQKQLANNVALGSRVGAYRMYSASDRVSKAFKLGN